MKIFISTDMEGIGGISSWNEMEPSESKGMCYDLLYRELSWIIEELSASSVGSSIEEICICDSHSRGEGLAYGRLGDKRITHIKGYPRPFYMLEGLDSSFDLVMLVGYHARIGALRGMMDHSYSASAIHNIRVNGREVGEVEINAYLAGVYNVPIAFISGDDVLESEVKDFFPADIPYARTKEGIGRFAGKMYSPARVEETFRDSVRQMLNRRGKLKPTELPTGDITLSIDFPTTVIADAVSIIPGFNRTAGRTAEYTSGDYRNIYRMILSSTMLGGRFVQYL